MTATLLSAAPMLASHATVADAWLAAGGDLSQQAAALAVSSAWQGLLIAFGLAVCLRLTPRTSAEYRFTLWAAAFVAIASLPLLQSVAGMWTTAAVAAEAPAATARPLLTIDARWSVWVTALWIAAALFRAGDLVMHTIRVRRIWMEAQPVAMEDWLRSMPALARASVSGVLVQVCTTTMLQRPCVIGFFRPRILIPDWLFTRLTDGELEQIVLHEMEHLRRRDDWTNLLQKLGLVLFPLNPALLLIERRLCREREMACDDGVIRMTRAPRAYAACLASLAERGMQHRVEALSLGAWRRRPEVVDRVHSILRRTQGLSPVAGGALLAVFGCGLVFGSVALARCPQLVAFVPARAAELAQGEVAAAGGPVLAVQRQERMGSASVRAGFGQRKTASYKQNADAPAVVPVKAELGSVHARAEHEQQWVVLTAWEQVETTNLQTGLTADYEMGADGVPEAVAGKTSSDAQVAGQMTVTQLIFRIVPASGVSASSVTSTGAGSAQGKAAAVPSRSSWFVLQL